MGTLISFKKCFQYHHVVFEELTTNMSAFAFGQCQVYTWSNDDLIHAIYMHDLTLRGFIEECCDHFKTSES